MKRISVYLLGGRSSLARYRIYQFTDELTEYNFIYHRLLPDLWHRRWSPISKQNIFIKLLVGLLIYFRSLFFLLCDYFHNPDILIISRRVIPKILPPSYQFLLKRISDNVPIIWDFDDDIVECKDISQKHFDFYSDISSRIFCIHVGLKNLIKQDNQNKVVLLPTTDGELFRHLTPIITQERINSLRHEVRIVWVATNVNLPNLISVCNVLDKAAQIIKTDSGRDVSLQVICNSPLNYSFENLKLINTEWSRSSAIDGLLSSHIGIMPLIDSKFSKGKGGFKLVQYISVGLPCVGSNVGFNSSVIGTDCGFLVEKTDEWIDALIHLSNISMWEKYSTSAFDYWSKNFSFEKSLSVWKSVIENLITTKAKN